MNINSNFGSYNNFNPFLSLNRPSSSMSSSMYNLLSSTYGVNNAVRTMFQTSSAIRTAGESMNSLLRDLTRTGSSSLFNQIGGVSENNKVATASVDGSKVNNSELKPFEINVGQVATTQMNSGSGVAIGGKAVSSGQYRFEVQVGNIRRELNINVAMSDDNDAIQRKMVSAINNANLGVTASINYDTPNKRQTLQVASATTGTRNDGGPVFSIRDTMGNLAGQMGITNVSREAQNAIYSINGGERQFSNTNRIDMGNGVTVNLQGEGTTSIDFQRNGSAAVDKVKELVGMMNAAMVTASNSMDRGSMRLFNDVFQMTKAYSGALGRIGIDVSSAGVLTIDNDRLNAAANSGTLEDMFQGDRMGFANRLDRISSNMRSSNFYADSVDVRQQQSDPRHYDKYAAISMLFDMYF